MATFIIYDIIIDDHSIDDEPITIEDYDDGDNESHIVLSKAHDYGAYMEGLDLAAYKNEKVYM